MSLKLSYKAIAEKFSKIPIDGFFNGMSECLAQVLDFDCVMISTSSNTDVNTLQGVSIYLDGIFEQSFSYSVNGTPCENVLAGKPYSCVGNLAQLYPDANYLKGKGFNSYIGFPLMDGDNQFVGHIAIFSRAALTKERSILSVLKIASHRTVRELLRDKSVEQIEALNHGLRLPSGKPFFSDLVEIIANYLSIESVFIAQLYTPDATTMKIKALTGSHRLPSSFLCQSIEFAKAQQPLIYTEQACQKVPALHVLSTADAQGIVAIKLVAQDGITLGIIGVISHQPLNNIDNILAILTSFSARTVMELEHQNRERQLKYYTGILAATDDLMSFVDTDFNYRALNQAYCRKFGKEINQLVNRSIAQLHGIDKFEKTLKPSMLRALAGETHTVEMKTKDGQGNTIYIHGRHHPHIDSNGEISGVVVSARDVTELKNIEMALARSEERLNILYNKTPSMFFTIDEDFNISSVNAFGATKLGYEVDDLLQRNIYALYSEDDRGPIGERLKRCFNRPNELHEWEIRQLQLDGHSLWVKQTAQVVNTASFGCQLFLASEDISEKHRLSQKLSYQASHDSLTGLTNRLEFERTLRKLVERKSEIRDQVHILCYIDLDRFKTINDSCGHLAGDELLRNIAEILSMTVRKSDVLARIGGDEFAIIMENCQLDKAIMIAETIRQAVKDYVLVWKDKNYQVGASVGLTVFNLQQDTIVDALAAADEACYSAKDAGRDRVFVYSGRDQQSAQQRLEVLWIAKLTQAINQDNFELYAQPIVAMKDSSAAVNYELLLRLNDQEKVINAGEFMSIAAQYQLSTRIDEWVVAHAFSWLGTQDKGIKIGYCSINISASSLGDSEFLEYVLFQLHKHHISGEKICFEITEAATMSNLIGAINFMTELRKHGCLFALDDFGHGIASFSHLKNLPVDIIKISGAYIAGLLDDPVERATVQAISNITQLMGKQAVAGYVENQQLYTCLQEIGVGFVQGYYSGKPQPLSSLD